MQLVRFGLGVPPSEELKLGPEALGGKGAGLVWMDQQGVKVPPGAVIPTNFCATYFKSPSVVMKQAGLAMKELMADLEKKFGYVPLVSVRSGARVSMPGMMDTILNVGIDAQTYPQWVERLGLQCANDSYCRLIEMYGSVVKGIDRKSFEHLNLEQRLSHYARQTKEEFPDAKGQLLGAIGAVFSSWNNERAKVYRKMHGYSDDWGTAVVVQSMVFGNLNDQSGTGVLFTRNPDTGENEVAGEFLVNAQGEDVVAGIRTPMKLSEMHDWNGTVADELLGTVVKLEKLKKDVQDVEFTIQNGELFILQTRNAKRSAAAAIRIAIEMHEEGILTDDEALARVTLRQYDLAQTPVIDPKFKKSPNWTALPACSGVVTGKIVLTSQAAIDCKEPTILVREETSPDDIAGMNAAVGVLTNTGGATSHAAVVARGMNKPCVVGLGMGKDLFEKIFVEGEVISIDGATGRIWKGEVPTVSAENSEWLVKLNALLFGNARLHDNKPGPNVEVLDLGDDLMDTKGCVEKITAQLAYGKPFMLDLAPSAAGRRLYDLGGENLYRTLVRRIDDALAPLGATNMLVRADAPMISVKAIAAIHSLDELVSVAGSYVFEGKMTSAVERVMGWLAKDGINPHVPPETVQPNVMMTKRLCV